MASRAKASRLLRIALSRPAGGRWFPALIQIALILAWNGLMFAALTAIPFDRLGERASLFWYRTGLTSHYVSNFQNELVQNAGWQEVLLILVSIVAGIVLLEGLFGWFGYRIINRKMRPRWYRFLRMWWRSCLYATLITPAGATVLAIAPWWPESIGAGELVLLAGFGIGPAWLARREIVRRGRLLNRLCPVCRYCLRGSPPGRCPECGTPIVSGGRGGYVVDPAELRESRARRWRRRGRVVVVVGLLILGSVAGLVGRGVYYWYLSYRGSLAQITLPTAKGSVIFEICIFCQSVRTTLLDGSQECPVRTEKYEDCPHDWRAALAAWSAFKLSDGDVLLIRRAGHYNAVKILDPARAGGPLRFEWYHQPNKCIGTFVDDGVERGEATAVGKIGFKDVDVLSQVGFIWYDYYFGGVAPASPNTADPHYVAYAGKVDITQVDAADPRWIYKTWEDGKPNGYEKETTRPDLRLSAEDKRALEFIWGRLSPDLEPRDDEELARFRVLLERDITGLPRAVGATPIWPDIREDFLTGGRPGGNPIWDALIGYRIAEVSTQGLGRMRGVVVPVFRTVGHEPALVVQTESDAVKVMLADVALLRLGTPETVQPSAPETSLTSVPVRIRTRSGEAVEGVIASRDSMQTGLDYWLYPFKRSASAPVEFGGSIHLTVRIDQPSAIPLVRYGWVAFTDISSRVCPKCGLPAESMEWIVCPMDGTRFELPSGS